MRCHSKERPYKCETCGKSFKYGRNLRHYNDTLLSKLKSLDSRIDGSSGASISASYIDNEELEANETDNSPDLNQDVFPFNDSSPCDRGSTNIYETEHQEFDLQTPVQSPAANEEDLKTDEPRKFDLLSCRDIES